MPHTRLWLSGCLLAAVLPASAGEPLMVKVTPPVARAPAFLTVQVVVDKNSDNRAIEVAVESSDFYTNSRIDLDAERAPRNSAFTFHDLPSGKYQVRARLIGSRGTRATAFAWFQAGFDRSR